MSHFHLMCLRVCGFALHVLYSMLASSAERQFVVENKTQVAFTVTNRIPADDAAPTPKSVAVQAVKQTTPATLTMGNPWFVGGRNTSIGHLIQAHGYTREQLAPYANDPASLNRIHGAAHEWRAKVQAKQTKAVACPSGVCPTAGRRR